MFGESQILLFYKRKTRDGRYPMYVTRMRTAPPGTPINVKWPSILVEVPIVVPSIRMLAWGRVSPESTSFTIPETMSLARRLPWCNTATSLGRKDER